MGRWGHGGGRSRRVGPNRFLNNFSAPFGGSWNPGALGSGDVDGDGDGDGDGSGDGPPDKVCFMLFLRLGHVSLFVSRAEQERIHPQGRHLRRRFAHEHTDQAAAQQECK